MQKRPPRISTFPRIENSLHPNYISQVSLRLGGGVMWFSLANRLRGGYVSYFLLWLINRCNTSVSFSLLPLGEDTLGVETTKVKDGSILGSPGVAGRSTGQPEAATLVESPFIWGKHWLILVTAASAKVQIQRGLGTNPVMIFLLPTMVQTGDPFSRTHTLESASFPAMPEPSPSNLYSTVCWVSSILIKAVSRIA